MTSQSNEVAIGAVDLPVFVFEPGCRPRAYGTSTWITTGATPASVSSVTTNVTRPPGDAPVAKATVLGSAAYGLTTPLPTASPGATTERGVPPAMLAWPVTAKRPALVSKSGISWVV